MKTLYHLLVSTFVYIEDKHEYILSFISDYI